MRDPSEMALQCGIELGLVEAAEDVVHEPVHLAAWTGPARWDARTRLGTDPAIISLRPLAPTENALEYGKHYLKRPKTQLRV